MAAFMAAIICSAVILTSAGIAPVTSYKSSTAQLAVVFSLATKPPMTSCHGLGWLPTQAPRVQYLPHIAATLTRSLSVHWVSNIRWIILTSCLSQVMRGSCTLVQWDSHARLPLSPPN